MKCKFTILSNTVITFILALFGVGCESRGADMYGTPIAHHSVKGTVTGINNTEIEGVEVSIMDDDNQYWADTAQTNSSGEYTFNFDKHPQDTTKYTLSFKDIDGEKNGSYIDKTAEVTILKSELEGGEGWNYGSVTKEVNVQLEVKTEEDKLNK